MLNHVLIRLERPVSAPGLLRASALPGPTATSNAGEPPAAINTTYGSAWLKPLNVLQARYLKFGAQFTF